MSKKRTLFLALFLAGLAVGITLFVTFRPCQIRHKKIDLNIILITLDTTRPDHLGCYGYRYTKTPNIDRLAATGTRFTQAIAPLPITLPSHCSILTGLDVFSHGIRDNGTFYVRQDITTLAETLKKNGYKTAAVLASFVLDRRFDLDQGFDFYEDRLETISNKNEAAVKTKMWQGHRIGRFERPAGEVSDIAVRWLKKNYEEKFFLWVHYYDPHKSYNPPVEYRTEEYGKGPHKLYDGEIAYMDHELGRVLNTLKEKKLLDKSLIVVASDHGEALGEHNNYVGHGYFVFEEEIKTVLIFVLPYIIPKAKVISEMVNLADITPTVLDILGIKEKIKYDGKSLYSLIKSAKKRNLRELYCETKLPELRFGRSPVHALRTDKYKMVYLPKHNAATLHDLKKDPGEQINIFDRKNRLHVKLFKRLSRYIEKMKSLKNAPTRAMNPETKEKLKSLGYL